MWAAATVRLCAHLHLTIQRASLVHPCCGGEVDWLFAVVRWVSSFARVSLLVARRQVLWRAPRHRHAGPRPLARPGGSGGSAPGRAARPRRRERRPLRGRGGRRRADAPHPFGRMRRRAVRGTRPAHASRLARASVPVCCRARCACRLDLSAARVHARCAPSACGAMLRAPGAQRARRAAAFCAAAAATAGGLPHRGVCSGHTA